MIDVPPGLTNASERLRARVKQNEAAVTLSRRHVPVISEAELERDIRPPLVIGLNEATNRPFSDAAGLIANRDAEEVGRIC